ncbi:MAG: PDZ domain-containing protein [Nitrospiraceae bacterium]
MNAGMQTNRSWGLTLMHVPRLMAVGAVLSLALWSNVALAADTSRAPQGVIGVALQVGAERVGDPAVLYIAFAHPEGPAQKAGLSHGDEIVSVDGQALTGKTYDQVALLIRGELGTSVTLSVKGDGGAREVKVVRVAADSLRQPGGDDHDMEHGMIPDHHGATKK